MNEQRPLLLVTGASGFLGAEIVRHAVAGGWCVRAIVHSAKPSADAEPCPGDLLAPDSLARACAGARAVIHSAGLAHIFGPEANRSERFDHINTAGTANLAQAAAAVGVRRFVLVSSVSVYGSWARLGPCTEDSPTEPVTPYGRSKLESEQAARREFGAQGLAILRMATIHGAGDRGNVAKLASAVVRGRFIWPGDGSNHKSLIHKSDAAKSCLLAAADGSPDGIYNVSAPSRSMREIVGAICGAVGRRPPTLSAPAGLCQAAAGLARAIGDPCQLAARLDKFLASDVYDASRFERAFGFRTEITLDESMRDQMGSVG